LKLVQLKLFKVFAALAQGWIFPPWAKRKSNILSPFCFN